MNHHHSADCCHHEEDASPWVTRSLACAAALAAATLVLQWTGIGHARFVNALAASAVVLGGWFLLPSAWGAARRLRPNISLLMVIATACAAIIGEWAEAATVVVLFGVAEWLEEWADRRSRRAVRALLELAPETALVKANGGTRETPVEDVAVDA
ncbi:MAG: heavy metal translocating P-type ATPase, partial [Candidatus Acidiferrales bacterium]